MYKISNFYSQKKGLILNLMDLTYLFILGLYIVRKVFDRTMFELNWPDWYYYYLRIAMIAFLILKIIVYDIKSIKFLIFDTLLFIVFYYVYRGTGYIFLLELGFFILAAKDIAYQKILKFYFVTVSLVMLITILGALTGCIQDLIFVGNNKFEHAFGFVYTNNFAAQILFLTITYLAWKGKVPNYLFNIFLLFLACVLYEYTGAKNSFVCMILTVLGGLYVKYSDKVILSAKPIGMWSMIKLKVFQIIDVCLVFILPIAALVSLGFTLLYTHDNVLINKINLISSGRLKLGKDAIEKYGISLWGTPFKMIGLARNYVARIDYNFVDSSYVMIFVRYGIVFFAFTILGFVYLAIKVKRTQKRYVLVLLGIMSLQSIMEHHLLEVFFNPFVLLILSNFNMSVNNSIADVSVENNRRKGKYFIGIAFITLLIVFHSKLIAYARTLVTLLKLNESGRHIYFIFGVLSIGGVCIFTISMLWNLCYTIRERKKDKCVYWFVVGSVFGIILFSMQFLVCNTLMSKRATQYKERIQASNYVFERLEQLDDYNLYIDDIPYLYMKCNKADNDILPGTPYKTNVKRAAVITKATNEMVNLLKVGYMCGQISDTEYIYTNDEKLVKILQESGIKMSDYYALKQNLDLRKLAKKNKLSIDSDNAILISGSTKSVSKGLGLTIYSGLVRVNYELELLNTDVSQGEVARLKVTSYNGKKLLIVMPVYKSDFDENGQYIATLDCSIIDSVGVDFLIIANGEAKLKLKSISYEKIGKY
ncbi:hypothetical protein [Candidatus Galacturonibacter soehngenii]|uniref:Uncharacterized protein n=1 Tax=Candidatus Galacturonatibacter soehngenii TaxID=2307010 RepID=A0A7V7QKD7_9FIRM|nr:hypothetical protein [Candidatus Galacturonibacter soehngenii]KAB1438250.1 hypothetical protein F7O84_11915 [Candidatus Galacturonibacter soehngenii]